MAITTTREPRADCSRTMRSLVAAVVAVSFFQIFAPAAMVTAAMAQMAVPSKKQVHAPPHKVVAKPQTSPTDGQADELNERWLSDFSKAEAEKPASVTPTPAPAAAAVTPAPTATSTSTPAPVPAAAPTVAAAAPAFTSTPGTESERTLSAPAQAALPGAGARAVVPGTVTFVKADNAAAAFNSMPGGANQPIFKDLTNAFAGFAPTAAKVEMMQARTADGSSRLVFASIGDGKGKQAYWWFSPPDQPEGWFDKDGKRLGGSALAPPKPGARISSPFGTRHYYGRATSTAFHNGIDFEAKMGDPIYAAADGVVNHANWYYNYGRTVKITHSDHFETLYAHMSRIATGIAPGTVVHKGDVIGYVGSTGRSTGPHLHFSTIVDGKFVDPAPYISENGGSSTLEANDLVAYRQWQQDVRTAAIAQKAVAQRASTGQGTFWSRNPFSPPPSPGRL